MFLRKCLFQFVLPLSLLLVSGCTSSKDEGGDDGADTEDDDGDESGDSDQGDDGSLACEGDRDEDGNIVVIARDSQNYSFESSMEIQSTAIRANTDFTIDWSSVDTDMRGAELDPLEGVNMMTVMLWQYTREELMEAMNQDALDTANMVALAYVWTENKLTSANYLDVSAPGGGDWPDEELLAYLDPETYSPESHTYFITLSNPPTVAFGRDTRMVHLFSVGLEEENSIIDITNDSTVIDYTVDLHSLDPIALPVETPEVVLDWSDTEVLTTTGKGQAFVPTRITDVMVGHYASKTPEDLEQDFLNLENTADELYRVFLTAGQSVNLGELEDEDGNNFPGINDEGTWIVALVCGTCTNPAPWYFTVLTTCEG